MRDQRMFDLVFENTHDAIRAANAETRTCIGWDQRRGGWILYSPILGAPSGVEPELFCIKGGTFPIPLSESGETIVRKLKGAAPC